MQFQPKPTEHFSWQKIERTYNLGFLRKVVKWKEYTIVKKERKRERKRKKECER